MTGRREASQAEPDGLSRGIDAALGVTGARLPRTEREVAAAEAALVEGDVRLPAALADANVVFERSGETDGSEPTARPLPTAKDVEVELARAAREGGVVTPEIEKRMRTDREAAERSRKSEIGNRK